MKRFIAALLLLLSSPAVAQQLPFTLPANTVIGRTGVAGNSGPAFAIPYSQFAAALNPFFPSINPNVGTFGSSTQCTTFTVTAQGFITAASQTTCSTGITQLTGDVTAGPGSGSQAAILASTISAAGPIGSATAAPIITYDAKGRLTTVTSATITPAIGAITGLGTGCAAWLATPSSANLRGCVSDETGSGLAYFQGGDIGTPSAGVATNLSGTAASLTAGHVTTNANLTGDVTSVGNATTLATVNSNVGSFGSSTNCPTVTVNAKGLVTAASQTACAGGSPTLTSFTSTVTCGSTGTPAIASLTGFYYQTGKIVYVSIPTTAATTGTCTGFVKYSLPVTATSTAAHLYALSVFDSVGGGTGSAAIVPTDTANVHIFKYDGTVPTGYGPVVTGFYEVP